MTTQQDIDAVLQSVSALAGTIRTAREHDIGKACMLTQSQFDTLVTASQLVAGRQYFVTDRGKYFDATGTDTFVERGKGEIGEAPIDGSPYVRQNASWAELPGKGGDIYVLVDAIPDAGVVFQTEAVQAALNKALPGQTVLLPPPKSSTERYIRCGDITIPSGVNLSSAGSSPFGWTVRFGVAISQAVNTRLENMWCKWCQFKISSVTGFTAGITFSGMRIDGTNLSHGGAMPATAIEIGERAWNLKFIDCQIWNYSRWGIAVYGNEDRVNNTGRAFLGTAVFMTMSDCYIFNCGALGEGGGILLKGSARDGSSLHIGNILLDHCQQALVVDDSVNGTPGTSASGSGGWYVHIDSIRCELCGRTEWPQNSGTFYDTPSILNIGGRVAIDHIWFSSVADPSGTGKPDYKNIWHRSGEFQIFSGLIHHRSSDKVFGIYCDRGKFATLGNWNTSYNDVGRNYPVTASEKSMFGTAALIAALRFRITKGTTGIIIQHIVTDGAGFGSGTSIGQFSSNPTSQMSVSNAGIYVGNLPIETDFGTLVYKHTTVGSITIRPYYRAVERTLLASILKQTAGLQNLTVDITSNTSDKDYGFKLTFLDGFGAEQNLIARMPQGSIIEVVAMVALNSR